MRTYVEGVAKNLVAKLYGPAGLPWGVTLTEWEDVCLDIRAVLTEKMLDVALELQAADHPQRPQELGCCPQCRRPLVCDEVEPRVVQTRAGQACGSVFMRELRWLGGRGQWAAASVHS